jgi:aspartyl-tRNA(Asn)/glutamyl-tRNA(Gln) amidotransferase subunit A
MDLKDLTISKVHNGLTRKDFTCEDLARAYLARIYERQPLINAFITVTENMALEQAQRVDEKIAKGEGIGSLEGVPCAIKDNILVQGVRATAGSKILEHYTAAYNATVVEKLKKAGVVILGKTNMDEFAMGSSGETSAYGVTRNPVDPERVPGGTSSGSAAAVADNQCVFALGSDTGGSIRQPASFCGIVGFKPTYGAVSRYGLIAMASSLDQIGPLTKTVEEAEIVFNAIHGKDQFDGTTTEIQNSNLKSQNLGIGNLRIGVPKEYFIDGMDKRVESSIRAAIKKLEARGAQIKEVNLPLSPYALAVYYILMPAEVSANLARFDGIRYGRPEISNSKSFGKLRTGFQISNLIGSYCHTRGAQFGAEVRRRIMLGAYVLSAGYKDAYYTQAQKVRALIKEEFRQVFQSVDVLLTPTTPTPAFAFGEKADPLTMYLCDIFTVSANVAGIPGISIPCESKQGLPVGLQILGPQRGEELVFKVGRWTGQKEE